jgi:hypothetical protein
MNLIGVGFCCALHYFIEEQYFIVSSFDLSEYTVKSMHLFKLYPSRMRVSYFLVVKLLFLCIYI